MKKAKNLLVTVNSITEMHRFLDVPGPEHPLVSTIYFKDIINSKAEIPEGLLLNFYMIAIKKDYKGKLRYGQNSYDFDEGVMTYISPGQICYENEPGENPLSGCMLLIHPDLLRGYELGKTIKTYEFFSYAVNEALYLSQKEEAMMEGIMRNIEQEYKSAIDNFSQDVIISHIELLLTYSNRFYNRQFITRKNTSNDILVKLEQLLDEHFSSEKELSGLPTVHHLAEKLNVSPGYLSDMLRTLTGQNAQQHIHNKLIEKAKEILTTTPLSVSEIAYQLGFEYPQSFSKLFKTKTNVSPLEYRKLFN